MSITARSASKREADLNEHPSGAVPDRAMPLTAGLKLAASTGRRAQFMFALASHLLTAKRSSVRHPWAVVQIIHSVCHRWLGRPAKTRAIAAALCAGARRIRLLSVTGFPVSLRPRLAESAAVD